MQVNSLQNSKPLVWPPHHALWKIPEHILGAQHVCSLLRNLFDLLFTKAILVICNNPWSNVTVFYCSEPIPYLSIYLLQVIWNVPYWIDALFHLFNGECIARRWTQEAFMWFIIPFIKMSWSWSGTQYHRSWLDDNTLHMVMSNIWCYEDDKKISDCRLSIRTHSFYHKYDTWLHCKGEKMIISVRFSIFCPILPIYERNHRHDFWPETFQVQLKCQILAIRLN